MDRNFKLEINGKPHKIYMSMGLLHEVSSIVGHVELLAEAAGYNPDLRAELLVALLSERDEEGEIIKPINLKAFDAEPDAVAALLEWATGHVADFLLKTLNSAKLQNERNAPLLANLMPTNTGSKA